MSDDKPSPLRDVTKGLGLLFRAAKTAAERLPTTTKGVEGLIVTSAREVGRAIENVASTIEREVLGKRAAPRHVENRPTEEPSDVPPPAAGKAVPPQDGS